MPNNKLSPEENSIDARICDEVIRNPHLRITRNERYKYKFNKKFGVLSFIEKVNKDRNDLQNELIDLIKKARSFQLSSKSADIGAQITGLEKKFKEVDNKKKIFEKEIKKLSSVLK